MSHERVRAPRRIPILPRTRKGWIQLGIVVFVPLAVIGASLGWMIPMPGRSHSGPLPELTRAEIITAWNLGDTVEYLAGSVGERHTRWATGNLERTASHIETRFEELGYGVQSHWYEIEGLKVRNVEAQRAGPAHPGEIVVVGAHYDSVPGSPGANDNASGVAVMLELARVMRDERPARTLRFVAFVNEEPPHFQTDSMGSLRYARACRDRDEDVVAMISIETVGYYSDEPGSQRYPAPFNLFYPDTGDFIGFVGNMRSRSLVRRCVRAFRQNGSLPSEGAAAAGWLPGIGLSDHWSFWKQGYPAVMVTDTALFRYPWYHSAFDRPARLDYERMARLVSGLVDVVRDLAQVW